MKTTLKLQPDRSQLFHKEPSDEYAKKGAFFMPLELRTVLGDYGIAQSKWAAAIKQSNGKGLSRGAATQILSWDVWPARTSENSIKSQTHKFLKDHGVSQADIERIWKEELDNDKRSGYRPKSTNAKNSKTARKHSGGKPAGRDDETNEILNLPRFEMLSAKAIDVFKINKDPFVQDVQAVGDIFIGSSQRSMYSALEYEALNAGIIAFIGESGFGKTTLRKRFQHIEKDNNVRFIRLAIKDAGSITDSTLCEAIIRDLDTSKNLRLPQTKEAKARLAEKHLLKWHGLGYSMCLLIEEAHHLTAEVLVRLKSFWEIEDGFDKILGIVLIGQPPLADLLNENRTPQAVEFIRRCGIKYCQPLDADLEDYLAFKFNRVGIKLKDIFVTEGKNNVFDGLRERLGQPRYKRSMLFALIVQGTIITAINEAAQQGFDRVNGDIVRGI